MNKTSRTLRTLSMAGAVAALLCIPASAMHVMEGYLPGELALHGAPCASLFW